MKEIEILVEVYSPVNDVIKALEKFSYEDVNVSLIKNQIQKFINSLGIEVSSELNMGKPEMMIKKFKIEV